MKHKFARLILLSFICVVAGAQTSLPLVAKPKSVTGQYRLRKDEFRNSLDVRQLRGGKIKFALIALWVSPNNPQNIHNGELHGVARLENGVAMYESGNCKVRMSFASNRVIIKTDDVIDDCGFGANVAASGTYRKINSKSPRFDF
ncbi:MAG TPA: hypothetical protein VNO50_01250 [Pyrinomonadaceae bacterium]|nr:hypothetical protein [Pyrinomonadaceae bacterium]